MQQAIKLLETFEVAWIDIISDLQDLIEHKYVIWTLFWIELTWGLGVSFYFTGATLWFYFCFNGPCQCFSPLRHLQAELCTVCHQTQQSSDLVLSGNTSMVFYAGVTSLWKKRCLTGANCHIYSCSVHTSDPPPDIPKLQNKMDALEEALGVKNLDHTH